VNVPLDRLVPGHMPLVAERQLVDWLKLSVSQPSHRSGHDVQEADADLHRHVPATQQQYLRLHGCQIVGVGRAVGGRIHTAEREAALVLQRRPPVGPQDVALVQDRVGDRPDRIRRHSPSLDASSESIVFSQLSNA
jgi:hypothetical protein